MQVIQSTLMATAYTSVSKGKDRAYKHLNTLNTELSLMSQPCIKGTLRDYRHFREAGSQWALLIDRVHEGTEAVST